MQKRLYALVGLLWLFSSFNLATAQQKTQVCKRVTKTEFNEKLNSLKDVQLVDVRTPGEFSRGTIQGAVNIDYSNPEFVNNIKKLDKTKPTLIFCQAGGRSAAALKKFEALGFEFVLELEGGYGNWAR
ncbi:MAG: rhodanese-like domain-containing protein [Crocinitomicaceae bacterium]|nr:rhodanese-like domain-containing protein [Crocinitomicaceae bacterium]